MPYHPDPDQQPALLSLAPIVHVDDDAQASIAERFARFHAANPHIADALLSLARPLMHPGRRKFGVKMLYEKLRYEYAFHTAGDEEYRLNNDFTSRYSRLLVDIEPRLRDFIEMRELRS